MSKVLMILLVSILLSCTDFKKSSEEKMRTVQDSIHFYYEISRNENHSLDKQIKAINKSFDLAQSIKKDTLFSRTLYRKNRIHYDLEEYDSLLFFGRILEKHAKAIQDDFHLGRLYYLNAHYYDNNAKIPDSAFYFYNLSKNYYKKINDSIWIGRNSLGEALIQQNQGDYFGSKETITETIKYIETLENAKLISSAYNTLATNHRKLLNYDGSIEYYIKAIETTKSEIDKLIYKNNLSATYIDSKQYEHATSILDDILKNPLIKNNNEEHARVIDNKAYVEWLVGGNSTTILKDYNRALKMRIEQEDERGQISSYTHLGEYFSVAHLDKAIKYLYTAIQISKKNNIPKGELDALRLLMRIQKNNIDIRDRHILLRDSLYKQELKVSTKFAKYKYDNEEFRENNLRLKADNAIQALVLNKERIQKIGYLFGLIIASLTIGFVIYFYRQRTRRLKEQTKYLEQQNKIEKLETAFETEAKLSRKVHDDFSGNIYQAMVLVENEGSAPEVLDVLEGVYNQSRDFSREINEVGTGENYEKELFGMLKSYLLPQTKLYTKNLDKINWEDINGLEKITIYKVLQELMINMKKYSRAKLVTLVFARNNGGIKISYMDNGQGATSEALNVKNGLQITEKRIQDIGGTIIFETEKGNGFKATVQIPN